MRAGRHGDAARWVESRRKFHDSVDAQCRAANERQRMELFNKQQMLCNLLHHTKHDDRKVLVAEPHGPRHILLMVSRPGPTKGTDEILLRIEDHD